LREPLKAPIAVRTGWLITISRTVMEAPIEMSRVTGVSLRAQGFSRISQPAVATFRNPYSARQPTGRRLFVFGLQRILSR
jgi:hypothetical protein